MAELMWIAVGGGLVLLTLAYVRLCEGLWAWRWRPICGLARRWRSFSSPILWSCWRGPSAS